MEDGATSAPDPAAKAKRHDTPDTTSYVSHIPFVHPAQHSAGDMGEGAIHNTNESGSLYLHAFMEELAERNEESSHHSGMDVSAYSPLAPAATVKKTATSETTSSVTELSCVGATHLPTLNVGDVAVKDHVGSFLQTVKKYVSANNKVKGEKLVPFHRKYSRPAVTFIQRKGMGSFNLPDQSKSKVSTCSANVKWARRPAKPSGKRKRRAAAARKKAKKPVTVKKAAKQKLTYKTGRLSRPPRKRRRSPILNQASRKKRKKKTLHWTCGQKGPRKKARGNWRSFGSMRPGTRADIGTTVTLPERSTRILWRPANEVIPKGSSKLLGTSSLKEGAVLRRHDACLGQPAVLRRACLMRDVRGLPHRSHSFDPSQWTRLEASGSLSN